MGKKVVLITGCSSGIGKALSEEFHQSGFRVIASARRPDSLADLQEKGIVTYALDVTDRNAVDHVISAVLEKEKRIDILVNNAGYGLMGPMIEIPEEELIRQFQTNVMAPLVLAQKVAPIMKKQGYGLIFNIGSISGIVTTPFSGAYCASKAALHSFSDALRMELSPFGIHVVSVQPGGIKSEFGKNADAASSRILRKDSWYQVLENEIKMRASISQADAFSAEDFAKKLAAVALAGKPPAIVRFGKKSLILPLLKILLPINVLDNIFRKKFGLTQI